ncbi:MAG: glycosyltransferase family 1 protein [Candidatus Methanofastidiosa archaeon]|nr:glycosyltransferase family 1 protein [Candidatus Methanofastidiosa archaeon]
MSDKITIVHIVSLLNRGGVEVWLLNLLNNFDRDKYEFVFIAVKRGKGDLDDQIRSLGGKIVTCPLDVGYRKFSKEFKKILLQVNAQVVHTHLLFFSGLICKLAKKVGIPSRIVHIHNTNDGHSLSMKRKLYHWLMKKRIHKYCTSGLAVSAMAADYGFMKNWRKYSKYQILPCGIDTRKFTEIKDRAELCKEFGLPLDSIVVGHVGSFRMQKNHTYLIRVAAEMIKKNPKVVFLLIGEGPLQKEIRKTVYDLKLEKNILFAGARNDVPTLMKNLFDIFIFPSLYEGLGVVVIEAQCAGVPCLISKSIPPEVCVLDNQVFMESIDEEPRIWADKAMTILSQSRINSETSLATIQQSLFSIDSNILTLSGLYSSI